MYLFNHHARKTESRKAGVYSTNNNACSTHRKEYAREGTRNKERSCKVRSRKTSNNKEYNMKYEIENYSNNQSSQTRVTDKRMKESREKDRNDNAALYNRCKKSFCGPRDEDEAEEAEMESLRGTDEESGSSLTSEPQISIPSRDDDDEDGSTTTINSQPTSTTSSFLGTTSDGTSFADLFEKHKMEAAQREQKRRNRKGLYGTGIEREDRTGTLIPSRQRLAKPPARKISNLVIVGDHQGRIRQRQLSRKYGREVDIPLLYQRPHRFPMLRESFPEPFETINEEESEEED